jgi:hypothetical protein
MKTHVKLALLAAGWLPMLAGVASAQMFGNRTLGVPLSQRLQAATPTPAADGSQGSAATGVVPANARFLRQNRSASAFVGSGAQAASHFVGAENSATSSQPAVTDLSSQRAAASANRQLQAALATPPPHVRMYPARLQVSFEHPGPATRTLSALLSERLRECPQVHAMGPIEVLLAGRTAIVRGVVVSERDRSLVQQLLLFEPGVSVVQNELKVQPPLPNQTPPLTALPPSQAARP